MSGQKLIKNAKNDSFWKPEACGQTVLPDKWQVTFNRTKIGGKCQIKKIRLFGNFQTVWTWDNNTC